ncbi:phosphoribosylanthranilate isomerase [Nocardia halotolerans]|uniref:N-(5'-phosphoribosyl)anthranilate isomerase n=1 Tax=Nocardia halotolerans TaxID=1755878 RepID=A0ABV8VD59_9NOCA
MTVRAKICGIRSTTDLQIAVDAGADAVGFISGITHFSEDGLSADAARQLAEAVPPFINKVLVTHLENASEIIALADEIGVDTIQVHGLVSMETLRQVKAQAHGRTVLRAVHVTGTNAVAEARTVAANCDAVLLDSRTEERLGGTGRTHDWSISAQIVSELSALGCPVVLAGGLTASNVGEAIAAVNPFGVDVNSGVEDNDGDKSVQDCVGFVATAHAMPAANTVPSPPR